MFYLLVKHVLAPLRNIFAPPMYIFLFLVLCGSEHKIYLLLTVGTDEKLSYAITIIKT